MGTGYYKKEAQTSPVIPEPANVGLRLLARMIVESLQRQQAESKHEPGGAEQAEIPPETNS